MAYGSTDLIDELRDEISNLKTEIQKMKDQQATISAAFAEWIVKSDYYPSGESPEIWYSIVGGARENKTTAQLYELFS